MSFVVANPGGSLSAYATKVFFGQIKSFGNVTQTKGEDNSSSEDSMETLLSKLLEKQKENFIKSFDKSADSDDDKKKEFKKVVNMLMGAADKNKDGLSMQELQDFDTSKLSYGDAKIVNDIIANFSAYDTDQDGLLTLKELENPLLTKEFSMQELAALAKSMFDEGKENLATFALANAPSSYIQKLLSNYDDTNLFNCTPKVLVTE